MGADRSEFLTVQGREALEEELARLIDRRPEVVELLSAARNDGDIAENTALAHARDEQAALEGRIARLEAILRSAGLIEEPDGSDVVRLGSRVTVADESGTIEYRIVGALESDPAAGRISAQSPVGRALMGTCAGETVLVHTPAGCRSIRVRAVA